MPKGKTNQPLTFVVPPEWLVAEVFRKLEEQGHTLVSMPPECLGADIVFGTNCHIMTEDMMTQKGIIDVALRAARKKKRLKD